MFLRDLVPFVQACNFIESNTPPWVFFKLYKWYQIAQRITYFKKHLSRKPLPRTVPALLKVMKMIHPISVKNLWEFKGKLK